MTKAKTHKTIATVKDPDTLPQPPLVKSKKAARDMAMAEMHRRYFGADFELDEDLRTDSYPIKRLPVGATFMIDRAEHTLLVVKTGKRKVHILHDLRRHKDQKVMSGSFKVKKAPVYPAVCELQAGGIAHWKSLP